MIQGSRCSISFERATLDSFPMRDGVDFAILFILLTTRKARCNIWVRFTTIAQMG